jgi:hypothetical protein
VNTRVPLNDLHFGDKAWFVVRDGNASIEVDYDGQTYELSMICKGPVGFPQEPSDA